MYRYRIGAINSETTQTQLLVASAHSEYQQLVIEKLIECSSIDELRTQLKTEKLSCVTYNVSGVDTLVECTEHITDTNFAGYKTNLGINDTLTANYFNIENGAIIAALNRNASNEISTGLKQLTNANFAVMPEEIALTNLYLRVYPQSLGVRAALLIISENYVTVIVLDSGTPITIITLLINERTINDVVSQILATGIANAQNITKEAFTYELILVAGNFELTLIDHIKELCTSNQRPPFTIERFNPLLANCIDINNLSEQQQLIIETEFHKYAVSFALAFQLLEYTGIDLSTSQLQLFKNFSTSFNFYIPQSLTTKIIESANQIVGRARAAVANENRIVFFVLVIAVGLLGYKYYDYSSSIKYLDNEIKDQQAKVDSMKFIKTKYADYKNKVKVRNDRIKAIQTIQQQQLTIPTIVKHLQTAQAPLADLMNIEILEVVGKNIKLAGRSIDKSQTVQYFRKIADTGDFIDVNPIYDHDPGTGITCKFKLSSIYSGKIPVNIFDLPVSTSNNPNLVNQISQK